MGDVSGMVKCRYCKGGGNHRHFPDEDCAACTGTGLQPPPRKKLQSLVSVDQFMVAVDKAEDDLVDTSISSESTPESECAYLVGAKDIVQALAKRLPHFVVRLDTQHDSGKKNTWYFRPAFRKTLLIHCLRFLLGKEADVAYHLRTLDVRYAALGRWDELTERRLPSTGRKRWRLWTTALPEGYELA